MSSKQKDMHDYETPNLAERLELLEARLRTPSTSSNQAKNSQNPISDTAHVEALYSPPHSSHSFKFDGQAYPSSSVVATKNSRNVVDVGINSDISHLSTSIATSNSAVVQKGSSLEAVSLAAEEHIKKVKNEGAFQDSTNYGNIAAFVGSPLSNCSQRTVQTSHHIRGVQSSAVPFHEPRIVKESPPAVEDRNSGNLCPIALETIEPVDNSTRKPSLDDTTTVTTTKTSKRKSTPVKKESQSVRLRKQSKGGSCNKSDPPRKRTRLQFSDNQQKENLAAINLSPNPKATDSRSNAPLKHSSTIAGKTTKTPKNNKLINDFFTAIQSDSKERVRVKETTLAAKSPETCKKDRGTPLSTHSLSSSSSELEQVKQRCSELEQLCEEKDSLLKAVSNNRTILQTAVQSTLKQREAELVKVRKAHDVYCTKVMQVVEDLVRQQALQDAQRLREKLASDGARLGRIVHTRTGMRSMPIESWEEGPAFQRVKEQRVELQMHRHRLEEREKKAKIAVQSFKGQQLEDKDKSSRAILRSNEFDGLAISDDLDALEAIESVRSHLKQLRNELADLEAREKQLKEEKVEHIRALKRAANEDSSRFRDRPKLHERYVLLCLLGKGGFSEVWRAFDAQDMKEVAVKIHQLDPRWSEDKKENYTKHVSREYEIHRNVQHPRIVSLLDVFEIDCNSFATVLECCDGTDLETVLKQKVRLPERDSRAILLQILSGMKYLSHPAPDESRQPIIHYDLKPGNILFDSQGDAKITDFGLSKIVEAHDPGQSMELTSQGAGTYWYLPPECFVMDENVTVKISNKVDVWSIGVIYFQMLYGKRPFGHGLTQDRLLTDKTMLNATEVVFPKEPHVSEMGKQFIRDCLQYDQGERPTIRQLCERPYVTNEHI